MSFSNFTNIYKLDLGSRFENKLGIVQLYFYSELHMFWGHNCHQHIFYPILYEHMGLIAMKPDYACEQQRHRPVCKSSQTDQCHTE